MRVPGANVARAREIPVPTVCGSIPRQTVTPSSSRRSASLLLAVRAARPAGGRAADSREPSSGSTVALLPLGVPLQAIHGARSSCAYPGFVDEAEIQAGRERWQQRYDAAKKDRKSTRL